LTVRDVLRSNYSFWDGWKKRAEQSIRSHVSAFTFETAIIERRRRESSAEEALIEMYLAGVSVRKSPTL
jgi:hypothetical protein